MISQKTIAKEFSFSGKALQTGKEVKVNCKSAGPDAGIVFKRVDLANSPIVRVGEAFFLGKNARRTTIGDGVMAVQTVEHFLAALWCQEIDNIIVEINGIELPGLDGSAIEFVRLLKSAGAINQASLRRSIKITDEERIEEPGKMLAVFPDERFSVSYLIDYDVSSIGRESLDITLDGPVFEREIAPARTFCLKREVGLLLRAGFGRGADLNNTLVMDETGPIANVLRFKDEPLRHKILDLVGDLYILGVPVVGRFVAEKSGHKLNEEMVKRLYKKYVKNDK